MTNIKRKIITYFAIYKIIQKIKKSIYDANRVGKELFIITHYIYNNQIKNNIYDVLINDPDIKMFSIVKYFNNYIIFEDFIKLFSIKLFKINIKYLTYFIRGYYLNNNNNLYSTNINTNYLSFNYFVLYDFYPYFLEQIYYYIKIHFEINNKIKFLINLDEDKYSINDFTDICTYKLVFIHKHKYYNNSIKNILEFIFTNISDIKLLNTTEEKILFNVYNTVFINNNINY